MTDEKNSVGLRILAIALVLGLLGDSLLRATPWGINLALWILMLGAFVAVLGRRSRALQGSGCWLLLPVLLGAVAIPWRDSLTLNLLSVLAILVALALIVLRAQGGKILAAYLADYIVGGIIAWLNAVLGAFRLLIGDLPWRRMTTGTASSRTLAVMSGFVLALPLLLVFGGLLMSADAVFSAAVRKVLDIDFASFVSHMFLTAFFAWIAGGYLRGMVLGREYEYTSWARRQWFSLGIVEIGIVLGLLNLLFLSFIIVQFRYFFGGTASITLTPGLTYSEYARRGFFELVMVAALVLPLLLLAHWLVDKEKPANERIFRVLAGTQIVFLFVIMASAFQRMRLYQREYGWTEQRLYPTAFMGWLAVVFIWFALTVLRGRRQYFVFGAMVAGFLLIAALHVLNPDALIARVNLARAQEGKRFDAWYAGALSGDALPTLVAAIPGLGQQDRCLLATRILDRWSRSEPPDWRTWNYARSRALETVQQNLLQLRSIACPAGNRND
ncbi:MAG: DUF4153 domain-containing protein [Terriglobia bacterium]